jgi:hypothetical protein
VLIAQSTSLVSRLSSLAALVLVISVSGGCHVGESRVDMVDAGEPAPDEGGGGDDGDGDGEPPPESDDGGGDAEDPCSGIVQELPIQEETHGPGYDYDAAKGQGCIGNCHGPEAQDDSADYVWTAGGSLFAVAEDPESAPVPGATIVIEDDAGTVHRAVVSENGQFWFEDEIIYPATTYACTTRPETRMGAQLNNADQGNCNSGSCHSPNRPIFLTVAE